MDLAQSDSWLIVSLSLTAGARENLGNHLIKLVRCITSAEFPKPFCFVRNLFLFLTPIFTFSTHRNHHLILNNGLLFDDLRLEDGSGEAVLELMRYFSIRFNIL